MTKHTAAPWHIKEGNDGWDISSGGMRVAWVAAKRPITGALYSKGEANAHLVAAAPELLEALQGLLWPWDNEELKAKAEMKAMQAIAKAEGRAA